MKPLVRTMLAVIADTPAADGLIHFIDGAVPAGEDLVYVVQPVKLGTPDQDANGDTIPDLDLNGDGIPEFVDPSGTGLGLTGRIGIGAGTTKPILISTDSVTVSDVLIKAWKRTGFREVTWDPLGVGVAPIGHDLHGGFLSDLRDPIAAAARLRLECNLPNGPSSVTLNDPAFNAGNRYYLMSVAFSTPRGVVEEYGTDSHGVEHTATTTLPPCR